LRRLLFILFIGIASIAKGQFVQPCINTAKVQPFYMCNYPFYNPVCGCDNITYRNECEAMNNHGVTLYTSGVCPNSGINLDFFPNPVTLNTPLTVNLSFPDFVYGDCTLMLVDMYGKVWEQRFINYFNRTQIQFDMTTVRTGVYLIVLQTSTKTGVVKMFSKY
jgi:hypothetical protein